MAELHCQVRSRIANADHNDSLPRELLGLLVIAAVEVAASELFDPCKEGAEQLWVCPMPSALSWGSEIQENSRTARVLRLGQELHTAVRQSMTV